MYLGNRNVKGKAFPTYYKDLPEPITDERKQYLLGRLKSGDRTVIEELVLGHMCLLISIVSKYHAIYNDIDLALELVSVATMGVIENIEKCKHENFTGYITCIIHSSIDHYTRRKKLKSVNLKSEHVSYEYTPVLDIQDALNYSAPSLFEKTIVEMRLNGLSCHKIAQQLGVSYSSVYNTLKSIGEHYIEGTS